MASTAEPTGTLATALAHATRLLAANPALAEAQSREILKAVPGNAQALLLLGAALGAQGDAVGALAILEPLAAAQPHVAHVNYELGSVLGQLGRGAEAIAALTRAVRLNPNLTGAWRALGDQLTLAGDSAGADDAYARHIKASVNDPQLLEAAEALCDNRLAIAERLLRAFVKDHPTDVAAIRMLAETGSRLGRYGRRGKSPGALSRTGAQLRRRAAQLCERALPPEQIRRGRIAGRRTFETRSAQSGLSRAEGRGPDPDRRIPSGHRAL